MNQTWENGKKLSFRFGPNLGQQFFFFVGFTLTKYYTLLQPNTVCYFKRKTNEPTGENSRKSSLGHNFGWFSSTFGPQKLVSGV